MLYATCLLFFVSSVCLATPISDVSDLGYTQHPGSYEKGDFGSCANAVWLMPYNGTPPSQTKNQTNQPQKVKVKK